MPDSVDTFGAAEGPRTAEALTLAELLRPAGSEALGAPPDPALVASWVTELMAKGGCRRPSAFDAEADDDPRAFLWWLLRMAQHQYARLLAPERPLDPAHLGRLRDLLASRPGAAAEHAQLCIDVPSTLQRAVAVREAMGSSTGPVLAVGDDDGVVVALALLGATGLAVVDIDPRVLDWLSQGVRAVGGVLDAEVVDVLAGPVPRRFRGLAAGVVTDPPRSFEECIAFLRFSRACLAPDPAARLLWADHPDWNFEHAQVLAALPGVGLRMVEILPDLHAYPLAGVWLPDAARKARQLDVPAPWLAALMARTPAISHLYVLEPA